MRGELSKEKKTMRTSTETTGAAVESLATAEHTTVISCAASLDISVVQNLYGELQAALEAQQPVVIDATQVERADTAALQMFCAFFQEAKASGIAWQWQQPAPALREAARLLDLTAYFALPIA
jgi:anti-anti-sigma regulatory factor